MELEKYVYQKIKNFLYGVVREKDNFGVKDTGEVVHAPYDKEVTAGDNPVVKYYACIEMPDGTFYSLVMSKEDMETHARRHNSDYAKGKGLWAEMFDKMAEATVKRQLIQDAVRCGWLE